MKINWERLFEDLLALNYWLTGGFTEFNEVFSFFNTCKVSINALSRVKRLKVVVKPLTVFVRHKQLKKYFYSIYYFSHLRVSFQDCCTLFMEINIFSSIHAIYCLYDHNLKLAVQPRAKREEDNQRVKEAKTSSNDLHNKNTHTFQQQKNQPDKSESPEASIGQQKKPRSTFIRSCVEI